PLRPLRGTSPYRGGDGDGDKGHLPLQGTQNVPFRGGRCQRPATAIKNPLRRGGLCVQHTRGRGLLLVGRIELRQLVEVSIAILGSAGSLVEQGSGALREGALQAAVTGLGFDEFLVIRRGSLGVERE